jgi:predicted DNA-binding transcriptional regulator AlpA
MTMPRKFNLLEPLVPHFFYRRQGPVAKGVIGLEDSQIDEKIKTGELPPPVKAFESGRSTGWFGWQLIELQQRRLAKAAVEVEPIKSAEVEPTRKRAAPKTLESSARELA